MLRFIAVAALLGAAGIRAAEPAFAHAGTHDGLGAWELALHLASPWHAMALATVAAAAVAADALLFAGRRRKGRQDAAIRQREDRP